MASWNHVLSPWVINRWIGSTRRWPRSGTLWPATRWMLALGAAVTTNVSLGRYDARWSPILVSMYSSLVTLRVQAPADSEPASVCATLARWPGWRYGAR